MATIVSTIKNRVINSNLNCLVFFVGGTGSGKSYATMKTAKAIDPDFDCKKQVVFNALDFLELIDSDDLKPGSVVILEELGVSADSRNWYTAVNKALNYVFETFRPKRLIVFLTVPTLKFIDTKIRQLAHGIYEMQYYDKNRKESYANFKWIQLNGITGKIYYKRHQDHNKVVSIVTFGFVPLDISILYEKKRALFLDTVFKGAKEEIIKHLEDKKTARLRARTKKDIVEDIKNKYKTEAALKKALVKTFHKRTYVDKLALRAIFNLTERESLIVKNMLESELKLS